MCVAFCRKNRIKSDHNTRKIYCKPASRTLCKRCGLTDVDCVTVTLDEGEILLHGLLEDGVALGHDCGGKLACASCYVVVSAGGEALSPPSEDELDILDRAGVADEGARLACQAIGAGPVVVRVPQPDAPQPTALPVTVEAEAVRFLTAQLAKHPRSVAMRLAVAPAGCSGLRYRIDPVEALNAEDVVFDCGGVRVAIDAFSLPFVQGTRVRLAQEGLALRLRFDNPNARQSCGCGESFGT